MLFWTDINLHNRTRFSGSPINHQSIDWWNSYLKKEKLVIDWRKKQQTRACVKLKIQRYLDKYLPNTYGRATFEQKCRDTFQHIYDNYSGDGESIYKMIKTQS